VSIEDLKQPLWKLIRQLPLQARVLESDEIQMAADKLR